jgi:histidine triad (HIT) family protein
MKMEPCLFCRIAAGEIPTRFILEDELAVSFHDIDPQAPVHALVVPRLHIVSLAEAHDPDLMGHLLDFSRRTAEKIGLAQYRLVINTGRDAGQSVFHLHLHILGGRKLGWPPG